MCPSHIESFTLVIARSYKLAQRHPHVLRPRPCDLLVVFLAATLRRSTVDKKIAHRAGSRARRGASRGGQHRRTYFEIQTIVGLLDYDRLSRKPCCRLSPSPPILSIISVSSTPSDKSQLEPSTTSSRIWKALASCIRSWILSHHGEVGRNFDGGVLIVMHCRSHMTKTLASPRVPDGARRVFTVSGGPPFLLA